MTTYAERDLKAILHGELAVLQRIVKNFDIHIRNAYMKILSKPFIVVRAAGSFGIDLVAIRDDIAFPIEVKTSASTTYWLSKSRKLKEQTERMIGECKRVNLFPIYAYRLKHVQQDDPWRIFTLPVKNLKGRMKVVYNRIPKVNLTSSGNWVLHWQNGMPLHKFIEYICLE